MHKYILILCISLSLIGISSNNLYAKQPSRFEIMDTNEDTFLDYNEFSIANPNFTKMAYDIMDADKDNKVSLEEWNSFMQKHSSPEGVKLDVEKRTTLKAKERPDDPSVPIAPTASSPPSPSSPNAPKNSAPSQPQMKNFAKQEALSSPREPHVQTPRRALPLLSPKEVKAPQVQAPKQPNAPQVQ